MFGSSARNSAASMDQVPVQTNGRRKLLNKRRGVGPGAIFCSVLLCGAAFAYAFSVTRSPDEGIASQEQIESVPAAFADLSFTAAHASGAQEKIETFAEPEEPTASARRDKSGDSALVVAQRAPRLQAQPVAAPPADDPRWAQGIEPVEDGFDWQGRVALSSDGSDIVTLDNRRPRTNPLIAQSKREVPQMAYAEPVPAPQEKRVPDAAPQFSADGLVPARTRDAVNMRAAGKKNASVITVVPRGAEVRVAQDCKHWCASVYADKRGYIYKSYITLVDNGSTASVRRQQEKAAQAGKQAAAPQAALPKPQPTEEDYLRPRTP